MNKLLSFVRRASQCPCNTPKDKPCESPKSKSCAPSRLPPYDYIIGPSGRHPVHDGGYKKYARVFWFLCVPLIVILSIKVLGDPEEVERPEFYPYPYLRKRDKLFPWSGGTERSFFHNPKLNALPKGYEE